MVISVARRTCLLALTTGLLIISLPALAQPEWVTALRDGGYVIVMRHGATHQDQADTDPLNLANVAQQRQLNDAGRAKAREIGAAMKKLGIPVGQVVSSQYFRAIETARLLGFGEPQPTADVSEGGQVVTPIENNRRTAALRKLAATAMSGTNVMVVSHKPNILDAFGKDWFDIREGEISIFKPDGAGGYRLVARVQADEWAKLAQ
ncbi:histidine phosphatase family protein [Reyranella soli]|uniref:Histidine phosphatase family protein n=1 Tax=Reyranella soli TaxID=1230389 RepID=A0A512N5M7_9HYPH|nr:histidine phosphatase family protein [Reyranella soli]GEP54280.1 histidine phosphatase family protein [Reyranella soli]